MRFSKACALLRSWGMVMHFVVECQRCRKPVLESDGCMEPLAPLEEHLRACHPEVTMPDYVGPLLSHFAIAARRESDDGPLHVRQ